MSSAQGMITVATYGVGMPINFSTAGQITKRFAAEGGEYLWLFPVEFALAVFVLFALVF